MQNSFDSKLINKIYEEIKDLDISILVNNVGVVNFNFLHEYTDKELIQMFHVNLSSMVFLT